MPKLRRVRMVSVGHDSARFEDVVLDFTDHNERPTNSILWLRNGGGKTSLLSLLFASIRPNRGDFLGKRADGKIRRIEDYVGEAEKQLERLHTDSVLLEDETVYAAISRIKATIGDLQKEIEAATMSIGRLHSDRQERLDHRQQCEQKRVTFDKQLAVLTAEQSRALEAKAQLEADDSFLRLLQTSSINADVSATKAIAACKLERGSRAATA